MESAKAKISLGYYEVIRREDREVTINLLHPFVIQVTLPEGIECRVGDHVRLLLEVPNANFIQPPKP